MWLWMPEKSLTSTPLIKRVCLLLPWRNIPVKPIFVVWLFQNAKICPRKFLLKKFNLSTESLHFRTVSNERDGCSWKSSLSLASAMGLLNHQGHGFLFAVSYALTALLVSIFPATCPPREGPRCCSLGFTCMPRAGRPPAQGDRGRLRLQLGCLNFHISFPSAQRRVSVSIRDQDIFDQAIFILYYIFSLLHDPLFLPWTEPQWVISLFSIINSLGKKKTRQSHCRDKTIFFIKIFWMFFSEAGFILIP